MLIESVMRSCQYGYRGEARVRLSKPNNNMKCQLINYALPLGIGTCLDVFYGRRPVSVDDSRVCIRLMRGRTWYRVEIGVMRGSRFSSCSILGISSTSEKTLSSIKSARSGEPASVRIEGPRRYMIPEQLITYNRSLADLIDSQTRFHAGRQNSQGHG